MLIQSGLLHAAHFVDWREVMKLDKSWVNFPWYTVVSWNVSELVIPLLKCNPLKVNVQEKM